MTEKLDRIKAECRRAIQLGEKATAGPWWNQHPCGGARIYPNGETHDWVATFTSEADCDAAIAFRTFSPAAARALLTAIEDLEQVVRLDEKAIAELHRMGLRYEPSPEVNTARNALQRLTDQWPE